jgi:hypothetical protein
MIRQENVGVTIGLATLCASWFQINLSHYDISCTDHPVVCRFLQTRFSNIRLLSAPRSSPWSGSAPTGNHP